eukprot:56360_1
MDRKLQIAASLSAAAIIAVAIKVMYDRSAASAAREQEALIQQLQATLAEQHDDCEKLRHKYNEEEQRYRTINAKYNKPPPAELESQMQALQNEKQQIFKTLLRDKKTVAQLEDTQDGLKLQLDSYQRQLLQYERQIAEYDDAKKKAMDIDTSVDADDTKDPIETDDAKDAMNAVDVSINNIQTLLDTVTREKVFSKRMTDLLTKHNKSHQLRIVEVWEQQHNQTLLYEIEKQLGGKTDGVAYRVLSGLLQSKAEGDKIYIEECVEHDMQIDKVANVIVSRTVDELHELQAFWKKINGTSLYLMLEKLGKHYNKNTMLHLFGNLCNTEQRERNKHLEANTIEIVKDVEWMMGTKKWKREEKEKMCRMCTLNSDEYVQILCQQYKSRSKNEHICQFIDTKLKPKFGRKSMFGRYLKDHIAFVEDPNIYFAKKLLVLAENKQTLEDNYSQILNIFLSQYGNNLNLIRIVFNQMHHDSLRQFIKEKGSKNNSVYFLMKILDNSKRLDRQ